VVIDLKGEIKKLIRDRGFGFIRAEDGNEVFFHQSALEGIGYESLEEGSKVEFSVERGQKGARATNIRLREA
jgi:CspA family cold shock protein